MTTERGNTLEAFEAVKPPVNISTGSPITNTGSGTVALPSAATGSGLAILSAVLGVVGLLAVFWKRK